MAVLSRAAPMAVLSRQTQLQASGQAIFSKSHFQQKPMAVLARPAPRAVLLRQKQPNGQTFRFEPRTANSTLSRAINLSAAGPSHSQQKPVQWPFYQDQLSSNCRLINADATQSFIFSKSMPNSRFIKASPQSPNGRFINAEAAKKWPDIQI